MDIDRQEVRKCLSTFGGVRHRTQLVGTWHGVTFINDSKGTNLDATAHALGAMPDAKTVLLLGGTDKGNDYSLIFDLVKSKAKALIFLTLDTDKLHRSFDCNYRHGAAPSSFRIVSGFSASLADGTAQCR